MKLFFTTLSLLAIAFSSHAKCCCEPQDYSFYIKVGTGISFSESADIDAPTAAWSPALQGYDSNLGDCAIAGLSIGCEIFDIVNLEAGVSHRSTFEYRKFQTSEEGDGSYKREFDLRVTPILFSAYFLGRNVPCCNWDLFCGNIYPTIGVGVGVSYLEITNFRTTGLPPTGNSAPYNSFLAENQYTLRNNFTYTVQAGLEYRFCDSWALSTGYRWFDAGRFKGPRYLRVNPGAAVDVNGDEWKMHFRSNEWFVEFKLYI